MALTIQLPLQATRYISTANVFNGNFNTDISGKYTFNIAANEKQTVLDLQLNTFYLIERIFISGNVPSGDFLGALDLSAGVDKMPNIQIQRLYDPTSISRQKLPVYQFTENRECPMLFKSDKKDDQLVMSLTGQMAQTADLVGIDPLVICVGLSIYEISEAGFNIGLRSKLDSSFGLDKTRSF